MPKNKCLKRVSKKRKKAFKFDWKKILKERREDAARKSELCEESEESDEEMKTLDKLFHEAARSVGLESDDENPKKSDHFVFDPSTYNIPFDESSFSDITKSCSRRFFLISIEQFEFQAYIHYNNLINAGWSPELNDVRNVLRNWDVDLDDIICKPLTECHINSNKKAVRHNFELVLNIILHSILRNNLFSDNDLLTLAKFAVIMYFDHNHEKALNETTSLFSTCITTALHKGNETDILMFAHELYSKYEEDHLLKMVEGLFLPLNGEVMKKIYTIWTFKLYKSLLGQTSCINDYPSNINEWFVQDLVDKNYLDQNSKKLRSVIRLLEDVVIVFDLYKDEKKLSDMYHFLSSSLNFNRSKLFSEYQKLQNSLDHWDLELFGLRVKKMSTIIFDNDT